MKKTRAIFALCLALTLFMPACHATDAAEELPQDSGQPAATVSEPETTHTDAPAPKETTESPEPAEKTESTETTEKTEPAAEETSEGAQSETKEAETLPEDIADNETPAETSDEAHADAPDENKGSEGAVEEKTTGQTAEETNQTADVECAASEAQEEEPEPEEPEPVEAEEIVYEWQETELTCKIEITKNIVIGPDGRGEMEITVSELPEGNLLEVSLTTENGAHLESELGSISYSMENAQSIVFEHSETRTIGVDLHLEDRGILSAGEYNDTIYLNYRQLAYLPTESAQPGGCGNGGGK